MRTSSFILLSVALLAALALGECKRAVPSAAKPAEVVDRSGRFRALFFGKPERREVQGLQALGSGDGKGEMTFHVSYKDLPVANARRFHKQIASGKPLEYLQATTIQRGSVVEDKVIRRGKLHGRQFKFMLNAGGFEVRRIFIVKRRIYELAVTHNKEEYNAGGPGMKKAHRLLDSFRVLE